ncbi:copper resistance CopC family protein [Brachybacterium sp. YJGR34]|uniref:copper resistance CopC family protein n=1 Tax=Brachybacterium sp. YJGR34 TaxID=2059911 RepID=UPI000E09F6E9|nr:copper resistance CopC family protein [Brachybacterium sp. YJGR34]
MTSVLRLRAVSRPTALLALAAALLLSVLVAAPPPASAHDTLLSSDPADGDVLETSPEAITLTYSADILAVSPVVRITDESGTELADITPTVDGPTATATLPEPLPAGTHTVQWRVVSSDGHPIEGSFTVTVEQDTEVVDEGAAAASDGGGEAPAASDGAQDESSAAPSAAEADEVDEQGGLPLPMLIGILAVVVLAAVVAVVVILRRRD